MPKPSPPGREDSNGTRTRRREEDLAGRSRTCQPISFLERSKKLSPVVLSGTTMALDALAAGILAVRAYYDG
jgi:hypothetical protein